jgi:hypothetical protein
MLFAFELLSKANKFRSVKKDNLLFPRFERSSKKKISFSEKCLPRTIQDNQPGMGQKVDRHHLWNVSGKNITFYVCKLPVT